MMYHLYNRGAHKALVFHDTGDYQRFLYLLYISNNQRPFVLQKISKSNVFTIERGDTLVDIHAYCLMPNHFHIMVSEKTPGSKAKFIQKMITGYTMYYNLKYKHSGTIFQGRYKSKPIIDELYINSLVQYIHLNPFGIERPELSKDAWQEYIEEVVEVSKRYEFSSFRDYLGENRPQGVILERLNL